MEKLFTPSFFGLVLKTNPPIEKSFEIESSLEKKLSPYFPSQHVKATPFESTVGKIISTVAIYFFIASTFGLIFRSNAFSTSYDLYKKNIQIFIDPSPKSQHAPPQLRLFPAGGHALPKPLDPAHLLGDPRHSKLDEGLDSELSSITQHNSHVGVLNVTHSEDEEEETIHQTRGGPQLTPTPDGSPVHFIAGPREGSPQYSPALNMAESPLHMFHMGFEQTQELAEDRSVKAFDASYQNTLLKTVFISYFKLPQNAKIDNESVTDTSLYSKLLVLNQFSKYFTSSTQGFFVELEKFFTKGEIFALYNVHNQTLWPPSFLERMQSLIDCKGLEPSTDDLKTLGQIVLNEPKFHDIMRLFEKSLIPDLRTIYPSLCKKIEDNSKSFIEIEKLREQMSFSHTPQIGLEIGEKTLKIMQDLKHQQKSFLRDFFTLMINFKRNITPMMEDQPIELNWSNLWAVDKFMKACDKL